MDRKRFLLIVIVTALPFLLMAQAKRPTLMVIPADSWCQANGFMKSEQGKNVPDYEKAWQNNQDLLPVVTKIGELMAERGFPLKDMSQSIKNISQVRADIFMEVGWTVNIMGPKRSVTYTLRGIDAYTLKQVAASSGTGQMSFSAELPVLLEEAVLERMDNFTDQLQAHFDDMMENGREVSMEVKIVDNSSGLNLTRKYGGDELTDIIDDWVSDNSVNHRYNLSQGSENFLKFEQIRIALYQTNGRPNDTHRWARELVKFLTSKYQIPCRVDIRGLGKAVIIIGEK